MSSIPWEYESTNLCRSSCPGHMVKEAVGNVTREFSVQGHAVVSFCRYITVSLPEIPCISYLLESLQSPESLACSDVSTDAEKLKAEASLEV